MVNAAAMSKGFISPYPSSLNLFLAACQFTSFSSASPGVIAAPGRIVNSLKLSSSDLIPGFTFEIKSTRMSTEFVSSFLNALCFTLSGTTTTSAA